MDTFKIRKIKRIKQHESLIVADIKFYDSKIEWFYKEIENLKIKRKKCIDKREKPMNSRGDIFDTMTRNEKKYIIEG